MVASLSMELASHGLADARVPLFGLAGRAFTRAFLRAGYGGLVLSSAGEYAVSHCRRADFSVSGVSSVDAPNSALAVLHGVPGWLDPLRPASPSDDDSLTRAVTFQYDGSAPSGARLHHFTPPPRVSSQRDPNTYLFVLPASATWIFATGGDIGARLRGVLAADASEPPWLSMAVGSFYDETDATAMGSYDYRWMAGYDQIERTGLVRYPPFDISRETHKLMFRSEGDASKAAADVQRVLADGSARRLTGCRGLVGARAEGPALFLDFANMY
jgi:hypothetical protein